ncbi:hypothetical protein Cantr_05765 [Candida viswanathii]|uniref:Uncharacterized protein n=1 Tax=Candida viswanathii TaxID=5486 RepID=A0A367XPX1_9ASCO|nr:hypothetical protein Cantr_05765 [Candida viswanathii]
MRLPNHVIQKVSEAEIIPRTHFLDLPGYSENAGHYRELIPDDIRQSHTEEERPECHDHSTSVNPVYVLAMAGVTPYLEPESISRIATFKFSVVLSKEK